MTASPWKPLVLQRFVIVKAGIGRRRLDLRPSESFGLKCLYSGQKSLNSPAFSVADSAPAEFSWTVFGYLG